MLVSKKNLKNIKIQQTNCFSPGGGFAATVGKTLANIKWTVTYLSTSRFKPPIE